MENLVSSKDSSGNNDMRAEDKLSL